jgi:hypothetical protein
MVLFYFQSTVTIGMVWNGPFMHSNRLPGNARFKLVTCDKIGREPMSYTSFHLSKRLVAPFKLRMDVIISSQRLSREPSLIISPEKLRKHHKSQQQHTAQAKLAVTANWANAD